VPGCPPTALLPQQSQIFGWFHCFVLTVSKLPPLAGLHWRWYRKWSIEPSQSSTVTQGLSDCALSNYVSWKLKDPAIPSTRFPRKKPLGWPWRYSTIRRFIISLPNTIASLRVCIYIYTYIPYIYRYIVIYNNAAEKFHNCRQPVQLLCNLPRWHLPFLLAPGTTMMPCREVH